MLPAYPRPLHHPRSTSIEYLDYQRLRIRPSSGFAAPGIDPWYNDSAAFTAYVREEIARIGKVVREAPIEAE